MKVNLNKLMTIPNTNDEYFIDYYGTVYHKHLTGEYVKIKPRIKKGTHKINIFVRNEKATERRIDKILDETFGVESANLFNITNNQEKRSLYKSEIDDMMNLYERGVKVKQIAQEYGISINSVKHHIKRRQEK